MKGEDEDDDEKGDLTKDAGEGKPISYVSPWMGGMLNTY